MKRSLLVLALVAAMAPVWAHHSFSAAYDTNNAITVKGVISSVRLQNPHSWFYLDVKDAQGNTQKWSFEAGTPSGMMRNGYKPGEIHAGVEVTIKGFHARDLTKNVGMLRELITADGKSYGMFGPQEGSGK
jgi:hypothetical protein